MKELNSDYKALQQLNTYIYLLLLKEIGQFNDDFKDGLVQLFRYVRLQKEWKVNKLFVSFNYTIVDNELDRIINKLQFTELITKDYLLTEKGNEYLEKLSSNEDWSDIYEVYKNQLSTKTGYDNTCLSVSTPTAANCGLCKDLSCVNKTKSGLMKTLFKQYFRPNNYQQSLSVRKNEPI